MMKRWKENLDSNTINALNAGIQRQCTRDSAMDVKRKLVSSLLGQISRKRRLWRKLKLRTWKMKSCHVKDRPRRKCGDASTAKLSILTEIINARIAWERDSQMRLRGEIPRKWWEKVLAIKSALLLHRDLGRVRPPKKLKRKKRSSKTINTSVRNAHI